MSGSMDKLRGLLDELEVSPADLRRDPKGRTWLPDDVAALCESDDGCADEVSRFVRAERSLYDGADVGADPFFTARVLGALPRPLRWTGLTPRSRALVLAVFHAGALVVAYFVLQWATPSTVAALSDHAHAWIEAGSGGELGPSWVAVLAAVLVTGAVAIVSATRHTRAT